MALLESKVERSEESARRREWMEGLVAELRERTAEVAQGGGETARSAPPRAREAARPASGSTASSIPGLPSSSRRAGRAAWDVYDGQAPSAGIVTGIGAVEGRACGFVANDATVKGGSYFPLTVKKHLRAQEVAEQNRLACIYLVDSGGAFLPLQAEVFPTATTSGGSSSTRRACPRSACRRLRW